jgi:peroxiredoxin
MDLRVAAKPAAPKPQPKSPASSGVPAQAPGSQMRSALVQLAFIAVAALAVYGFVQAAQKDQRRGACGALCAMVPNYAGRNRVAPDFELPDMDGKPVKLSSFRGKTVILNFWTITCGPCKEEIPSLADFQKIIEKRNDIVLLTVSTDEGPDEIRDRLSVLTNGNERPFKVLFDPDLLVTKDKYGTDLFPETWIIDPKGVIRARFDGARDWSGAAAFNVVQMANGDTPSCLAQFSGGKPFGPWGGLCDNE